MLILAWLLAIAGALVAFVVSLAGAMKTVPRLHWQEAIVAVPLPVLAAALALWCLLRPPPERAAPVLGASLALLIAFVTLLVMLMTYVEQPSGPI
ncbi:MAG: hypothetical protein SF182_15230 [Deltaproteobacteria bacterium]|nr:hypothetical protein [Deltaproteobacteria bacterium]